MFYYFYIAVLALLGFIAFVFNIDLDMNHSLQLILMFIGIFGTFGGAYLGARLAGKYSREASQEQRNFEISLYKKKSSYLKTIYYNRAIRNIKSMRKQDIGKPKKFMMDDNQLQLGGAFREKVYEPMDSYTLNSISKTVDRLNEFRLSDGYFYLDVNEIRNMDSLVDTLEEVADGFMYLNHLSSEGKDEEDQDFQRIKKSTFDALDILYGLE